MTNSEYARYVQSISPKSNCLKNCINAFWTGGTICLLGQGLMKLYGSMGMDQTASSSFVCISLILLSAILTGLALYDDIAKFAGAGTLVPITGFANSVVAPAVEFQTEGVILGTCAKMFTIAGPVIVFGVSSGVLYGLVYWISTLL